MGADIEDNTKAAPAVPSEAQKQAATRRRNRKRDDGPPQLQFVTATDPSQFKAEATKRSVRSQAMMQYRYESAEQKRKGRQAREVSLKERRVSSKGCVTVRERVSPVTLSDDHTFKSERNALVINWLKEPFQRTYATTQDAWWGKNREQAKAKGNTAWVPCANTPATVGPSRYHGARAMVPLNAAAKRVADYEDTEAHDAQLLRLLVARLARSSLQLGDGVDSFAVVPQFASRELNSIMLVRNCNRTFSSPTTLDKWLPVMLSHPHILLSSTILGSTWLDMHEGISADSKRTSLVKDEILGWIKERLSNAATQFEDSTLIVILHVLAGEMWSCNEQTLRIHQTGLARLIAHRGGMDQLGAHGTVAEITAAVMFHCDIICETIPLPLFYQWEPPPLSKNAETSGRYALPESPLFCPQGEFLSFIKDVSCAEFTYELLCDMRDLTDLFIAHHARPAIVQDEDEPTIPMSLQPPLLDYDARVAEIRARVAALPSAHVEGLPTTHQWVYEACRIAAIIYTSAIVMRVPFSVAAEPSRNIVVQDASLNGEGPHTIRLTEALYDVMEKTNTGDMWSDMSGVFFWVTSVGAAAARTAVTIDRYQRPGSQSEAYSTWIRRCLMMFATRAMIILVFPHAIPTVMAQKKLIKVQELIGYGSSGTLNS